MIENEVLVKGAEVILDETANICHDLIAQTGSTQVLFKAYNHDGCPCLILLAHATAAKELFPKLKKLVEELPENKPGAVTNIVMKDGPNADVFKGEQDDPKRT